VLDEVPLSVLLVEDNPGDARLIQLYSDAASGGKVSLTIVDRLDMALERLAVDEFDVVLLDLNLPDSQGLETLYAIMDAEPDVPVVVVSGNDDAAMAIKAVRQGAQDYLIKGPDLEAMLMRSVRYALERHHLFMLQREMSLRDELTRLYNRRGLSLLAEQQLQLASRRESTLTLLLADINGMKRINDDHGHAAGDLALKGVASAMRATFRGSDVLARYGGDEFVVLAIDAGQPDEDSLIERWRAELESWQQEAGTDLSFGLSIGAASTKPGDPLGFDELLTRADAAMYAHKRAGAAIGGEGVE